MNLTVIMKVKDDLLSDFLQKGVYPMECEPQEPVTLPAVKYDTCEDKSEGPDSFARHHAPVIQLKERIKELKPAIKEAKKSGNVETFREL